VEEGHRTTRIRLASALAVDVPGGGTLTGRELGSRKARTLLALFAAERGALVALDRIVEALEAGAQEYIMKPFDEALLQDKFVQAGLLPDAAA
jgi:hypothetical protein